MGRLILGLSKTTGGILLSIFVTCFYIKISLERLEDALTQTVQKLVFGASCGTDYRVKILVASTF
jgi:hypothetical protein